jgi:hypothetical protein
VERPALKREVVKYIVSHYGLKLARACRLIKQVRSTQYLRSTKDPKLPLRQRLKELAQVRLRWRPPLRQLDMGLIARVPSMWPYAPAGCTSPAGTC